MGEQYFPDKSCSDAKESAEECRCLASEQPTPGEKKTGLPQIWKWSRNGDLYKNFVPFLADRLPAVGGYSNFHHQ